MKEKKPKKRTRHIISYLITLFVNINVYLFYKINNFFTFIIKNSVNFLKNIGFFYKDNKYILREGFLALIICAAGDLVAGIILGKMDYFIEMFPGLLVLIPGAIGMRGNIFGSLGSRLSTNLHIGTLSTEFKKSEILSNNIYSSLILTLVLSLFLSVIAKFICILFGFKSMSLIDFILISVFAGLISSVVMIPTTMFISLKSYQNGWNPDNITTPLIAAFGDLLTLPAIIIAILLTSVLSNAFYLKLLIFILVIVLIVMGYIHTLRAKNEASKIIKQSTPILIISSFLGVSAGAVLNGFVNTLLKNPTLLTLVPLFSGESGSLISILGARISSGLHSGVIEPNLKPDKNTVFNFSICLSLAIFIYPFIGFLAEFSSILLHVKTLGYLLIIPITFVAGIILVTIMMFVVFYLSTISYSNDIDPDNIVIPISTSLTDSISTLILLLVASGFIWLI